MREWPRNISLRLDERAYAYRVFYARVCMFKNAYKCTYESASMCECASTYDSASM